MGAIALGMASSHAFTVMNTADWDGFRQKNRDGYRRRYGTLPPEQPAVAAETDAQVATRFGHIQAALERLRIALEALRPDAIVLVADDQNENFTEIVPQIAIYIGETFLDGKADAKSTLRRNHPQLAEAILADCVRNDIDMTGVRGFPEGRLFAHAYGPMLRVVDPGAAIPVVPVFVNAIHEPSPSPGRCYRLGEIIRSTVGRLPELGNVAIFGSGGLSHFTAGYPWTHYHGEYGYGAIDVSFDQAVIGKLNAGRGSELAALTDDELLAHGEIELRSWIVTMGAIGDSRPDFLEYQPFYRALMGMAVGCWTVPRQ